MSLRSFHVRMHEDRLLLLLFVLKMLSYTFPFSKSKKNRSTSNSTLDLLIGILTHAKYRSWTMIHYTHLCQLSSTVYLQETFHFVSFKLSFMNILFIDCRPSKDPSRTKMKKKQGVHTVISRYNMIVRVSVVLRRTVCGDID